MYHLIIDILKFQNGCSLVALGNICLICDVVSSKILAYLGHFVKIKCECGNFLLVTCCKSIQFSYGKTSFTMIFLINFKEFLGVS